MTRLNRRDALIHFGFGTTGWLCLARGCASGNVELGKIELDDLSDLAARIRAAPRAEVFDVASAAIRAGAGYQALLGAGAGGHQRTGSRGSRNRGLRALAAGAAQGRCRMRKSR